MFVTDKRYKLPGEDFVNHSLVVGGTTLGDDNDSAIRWNVVKDLNREGGVHIDSVKLLKDGELVSGQLLEFSKGEAT